jgi:F-type H+-transporting ATPase subunit b
MSMLAVSTTSSFLTASEGGGVNVDLDASLVVQIGLFIVLLLVLKPLLFDPMLKLFEEREKRTEGIIKTVGSMDEKSAKALAKYEAVLAKAREAGSAERDVLRREAQKKEAERMAEIREVAARTVEQGRSQIASEAKAARSALTTEAGALGRTIASRVLGREVAT